MNPEMQRELLAFEEKIALSKLEEAKATERTRDLEYQKARFTLEAFMNAMRAQQAQQQAQQQAPKV